MYTGFERHSIIGDGVELSFLACGTGQVVVILHGLAGESGEFAPTMARLAQQFRAVALDQRGHGRSTRRPSDVSRRAYVQDVVSLMGHVSPDAPVHLVGQSMGAHTAMLVAAFRPDLVQSLLLLEGDAGSSAVHPRMRSNWAGSLPVGPCRLQTTPRPANFWVIQLFQMLGRMRWSGAATGSGRVLIRTS